MGSAICSSHEEEKVFRIAKGIIPPHSSACMVIHWCSAACCAPGIKGLSLGKLQLSRRHMRANRTSFWIRHPQNSVGGGVMVKDLCPIHTYPPTSFPPPSGTGRYAEVRNSWVFEKLEFLRHINQIAKTEGGFSCPNVALKEEKKLPLHETVM